MSAEIQLGWNNTKLQAGARGAEAIVRRTTSEMTNVLNRVQGFDFKGLLGAGTAAAGTIGLAAGFKSLVSTGFAFNQTIGDSEVAIGNVLRQFQGLNEEAAKNEAAKAMQQMVELEPKTAASLTGLVDGFLATLGSSQAAGVSVEENIDLVGRFANALANANIPAEQLAQEMRSIISGNIGADSSLAKVLNISNADIERAREAGNLYDFLVGKVGTLGVAGNTAGVSFSSLESSISKAAGALTDGAFEQSIAWSNDLSASLERNADQFTTLGRLAGLGIQGIYEDIQSLTGKDIQLGRGWISNDDLARMDEGKKKVEEFLKLQKILEVQSSNLSPEEKNTRTAELINPELAKQNAKFRQAAAEAAVATEKAAAAELKRNKENGEILRQIEAQRIALGEKQFQVLVSHLTPLLQSEALQKRIKDLQEQAAGRDGPVQEQERLRIQNQIMDLQEQERGVRTKAADDQARENEKLQEKANRAAEIAAERQQELVLLDAELGILNAQAAGQDRKAAAMQRVKDIAEETLRIMNATGLSQDEAMKKATNLVDARNKIEQGGRQPGDRIQGYSRERQGGADEARSRGVQRAEETERRRQATYDRNFGGLREFDQKQKTRLSSTISTPGLDAYNRLQDRSRPVGAPMPAANGKAPGTQEMPTVEGLLKQLITTTEGLKEG